MSQPKLTQAQTEALQYIPESGHAAAIAQMLAKNEQRLVVVKTNREVFSQTVNQYGVIVYRGLNNRFPLGLRMDQVLILMSRRDEILAFIEANKALIETNSKNPRPRKAKKA